MENLSNEKTYNMGYGGYGPAHNLLLLDEAIDLKPQLIIEAFYSGNDVDDSYLLVYGLKQLSDLRTTDEKAIKAINNDNSIKRFEERFRELKEKLMSKIMGKNEEKNLVLRRSAFREFLAQHSKLYGILREIRRMYKYQYKQSQYDAKRLNWESIKQEAIKSEYQEIFDNGRLKTVFLPDNLSLALGFNHPRIVEGHRISLEAIRLKKERTQTAGIAFQV